MRKLFFLFLIVGCSIQADDSCIFNKNGVALNGYDPVAFFEDHRPVKGSKEFSYAWNEVAWHFSSAANLEKFKRSPDFYTPQYGGYCAYGIAEGHKSPTKPEAYTIINNKLFFNYNMDVKALWLKDTAGYIRKAEQNWPQVKANEVD